MPRPRTRQRPDPNSKRSQEKALKKAERVRRKIWAQQVESSEARERRILRRGATQEVHASAGHVGSNLWGRRLVLTLHESVLEKESVLGAFLRRDGDNAISIRVLRFLLLPARVVVYRPKSHYMGLHSDAQTRERQLLGRGIWTRCIEKNILTRKGIDAIATGAAGSNAPVARLAPHLEEVLTRVAQFLLEFQVTGPFREGPPLQFENLVYRGELGPQFHLDWHSMSQYWADVVRDTIAADVLLALMNAHGDTNEWDRLRG
jgi:hypothetical protein